MFFFGFGLCAKCKTARAQAFKVREKICQLCHQKQAHNSQIDIYNNLHKDNDGRTCTAVHYDLESVSDILCKGRRLLPSLNDYITDAFRRKSLLPCYNNFGKHKRRWYSGEHCCLPSNWPGFDSQLTQFYFHNVFLTFNNVTGSNFNCKSLFKQYNTNHYKCSHNLQ